MRRHLRRPAPEAAVAASARWRLHPGAVAFDPRFDDDEAGGFDAPILLPAGFFDGMAPGEGEGGDAGEARDDGARRREAEAAHPAGRGPVAARRRAREKLSAVTIAARTRPEVSLSGNSAMMSRADTPAAMRSNSVVRAK